MAKPALTADTAASLLFALTGALVLDLRHDLHVGSWGPRMYADQCHGLPRRPALGCRVGRSTWSWRPIRRTSRAICRFSSPGGRPGSTAVPAVLQDAGPRSRPRHHRRVLFLSAVANLIVGLNLLYRQWGSRGFSIALTLFLQSGSRLFLAPGPGYLRRRRGAARGGDALVHPVASEASAS